MNVVDFFKCPACTGLLKSPKMLPCGHNVCEKCLNIHIIRTVPMSGYDIDKCLESPDADIKPAKDRFPCPSEACDKEIKPRDPTKRTWLWAGQFENNLRLMSVMDMIWSDNQCSDSNVQCNVCMNMISDIPVTSICLNCVHCLCPKCAMVHRHINPSHTIRKLVDLPTNQSQITSNTHGDAASRDSMYEKCPTFCKIHSASEVTHFCTDCSQHCCIRCSELVHGSCRGVDQITFIYTSLVGRNEFNDLKTRFSTCHAAVSNILTMSVTAKEQEEKVINKHCQDFVGTNGVTLGKISALLDGSFRTSKESNKLKAIIVRCELVGESLKACNARMRELDSDTNRGRYTKAIIDLKKECTRIEQEVGSLKILIKEMKVTEADLQKKIKATDSCVHADDSSLTISSKITMRLDDETECWLTDCCATTNGLILVTDYLNCKLKWASESDTVKGIGLPAAPWSVSIQENNDGCITLPEIRTIQFFQIDNDVVTLTRDIKTTHQCYGAAFLGDDIVSSLRHDNQTMTVCILSPDGVAIKELSQDNGILAPLVFSQAHYLRVKQNKTNAKILVSDYRRHTVSEMKWLGLDDEKVETVRYTWNEDGNHGFPAGLAWDARGDVVVCCNSMGTVRRISAEGSHATEGRHAPEGSHVPEGRHATEVNHAPEGRHATEGGHTTEGSHAPKGSHDPEGHHAPEGSYVSSCLLNGLPMPRSVACFNGKIALTVDSGKMKNCVVVFEDP